MCVDDCDRTSFLESLNAPLTKWEIAEEKRLQERRKELMRGEIPA